MPVAFSNIIETNFSDTNSLNNNSRATSIGVSGTTTEPKKQKLIIWPEWNENDINAEKWEVAGKVKDVKTKPTSAPVNINSPFN
jgi:hypothetical protein